MTATGPRMHEYDRERMDRLINNAEISGDNKLLRVASFWVRQHNEPYDSVTVQIGWGVTPLAGEHNIMEWRSRRADEYLVQPGFPIGIRQVIDYLDAYVQRRLAAPHGLTYDALDALYEQVRGESFTAYKTRRAIERQAVANGRTF